MSCNGQGYDGGPHNAKQCPYYHDKKKDRRRALGTYQAERCQFLMNKKECPYKDQCQFAHNRVEEFYHPDKYKAKFCSSYFRSDKECEYGPFCSFAHNEEEITIELIETYKRDADFYIFHFKTVWCPYNEEDHERSDCVYAHNWQDYRRKPSLFSYSKDLCKSWPSSETVTSYRQGCANEFKC